MDKLQQEVWQTVQALNRTWTVEKNAAELKNYFHKDMVAFAANAPKRVEGGENCVAGWKYFSDNTVIHSWKEIDPLVQIYGDGRFAIVTYYFEISFDMNGHTIDMKGRDMFSLIKENGKWLVVADHYSPEPVF